MNLTYNHNLISFALIGIFAIILALYAQALGISYDEAKVYFESSGVTTYLAHISVYVFGQNDFAIRLPFIIIHSIAAIVFFKLSLTVCKKPSDALLSLMLFLLMPGFNLTALLVNKASLLLLLGLLSAYLIIKNRLTLASVLMIIGALSDNGFAAFLLGVGAWAFSDRKYKFGLFVGILFVICMFRFGFNDGGMPQGWFVETAGAYFALFSPLVFIFYLYALFKLRKNTDLLWQISFWSIALSLLLSLRQRVPLIDYAPYSAFALPLAVGYFARAWRTKLPEFRLKYKIVGISVFASLAIWSILSFCLQSSISVFENPKKSPIWPHLIAKELANSLRTHNIFGVDAVDKDLQLQLKWYGIEYNQSAKLNNISGDIALPIVYSDKTVATYYVTTSVIR